MRTLILLALSLYCSSASAEKSLFERLGGQAAITAVVDEFIANVAGDKRINSFFAKTNIARLKAMLVDQICEATGGPCVYRGRDMRSVHDGMGVKEGDFNALVEDLVKALDKFKVGGKEKKELLGALGGMKNDILGVGKASSAPPPAAQQVDDTVHERAEGIREGANLLDKAGAAKKKGSRSLAEQLFSAAENILSPEAVADLAKQFREGAPPRIQGALGQMAKDTAPQPAVVGVAAEEAPKPQMATLKGTVKFEGGSPGSAVVLIEPAGKGSKKLPPKRFIMEQRGRDFAPKTLVVPVGSTVAFPNFDTVYHNVFSRSETQPFDLGTYRNGQFREVVLGKEGVITLGCNLHDNMKAHVFVIPGGRPAIVGNGGDFSFRNLKPGKYRLRIYSSRSKQPATKDVTIKPDANSVAIQMTSDTADSGMDKFGASRDKTP